MFGGSTKQFLASLGLGFGLAVMTFTAPMTDNAHAAPTQPTVSQGQESCENHGYMWDSKKKLCANRPCVNGGQPGDTKDVHYGNAKGPTVTFWCDGFTGKWVPIQ